MKTTTLLSTLFALAIQIVAVAQTQNGKNNSRILPVLGGDKKSVENRTVYPTVISSDAPQAKTQISTKKQAENNDNMNYLTNPEIYSSMEYANQLIKEAESLAVIERNLRTEAAGKKGEAKAELIKAANELFKQGELKQIQASEIAGKVRAEQFKLNQIVFNNLLIVTLAKEPTIDAAQEINDEANRNFRMAKEMREEAYSLKNSTAKLGTMSNAEEKEIVALNEQGEAVGMLKKYAAVLALKMQECVAMK